MIVDMSPCLMCNRANEFLVDIPEADIKKAERIFQKRVPRRREMRYVVIRHHLPKRLKNDERKTAELVARIVKGLDEMPKKLKKDEIDDYLCTSEGKDFRK